MAKEKLTSKSEIEMPSMSRVQPTTVRLEKQSGQIEVSIPQKQVFSEELITRLTDRIKKI